MCLLIPALKNDRTSLSLRMREQTEGRRLNLKEHCQKKKKENGTTQAARTGVWSEQQQKTASVWTETIAVQERCFRVP